MQHLIVTAMSVKHYLNQKEMRAWKETALNFENFIKTLLGPFQTAIQTATGKLTPLWHSYKSLLDRLTPTTVNQRYDELKFEINADTEPSCSDQKPAGYEGHDYNGIVSQLNMDAQKGMAATAINKLNKESLKAARKKI